MKSTPVIVGIGLVTLLAILLFGGLGMTLAPHASAGVGFGGFGMMGPWMTGRYGGYGNMMGGFGFGGMLFGGLLMLLFWVLVIGGAIWLVAALVRGNQSSSNSHSSPSAPLGGQTVLEVLKMRYAKGEITKEQFDDMRRDLSA